MSEMPLSALFVAVMEWAGNQGQRFINQLEGCWQGTTDKYTVKVNGHNVECSAIPPFSAAIFSNGWPIALVGPTGGAVMMGAREDDLIQHFQGAAAIIPHPPYEHPGDVA